MPATAPAGTDAPDSRPRPGPPRAARPWARSAPPAGRAVSPHRGWPGRVASPWTRSTRDDGLTAFASAPNTPRTRVGGGATTVERTTDHPFEETVSA